MKIVKANKLNKTKYSKIYIDIENNLIEVSSYYYNNDSIVCYYYDNDDKLCSISLPIDEYLFYK